MTDIIKEEFKRKAFHQLLLLYAFGYWFLPKSTIVIGLSIALVVVITLEIVRFKFPGANVFFQAHFKGLYRKEEINKVSALAGTLGGGLVTILMYDNSMLYDNKTMVMASFLYLAFGDAAAALAGKSFGKHKIFSSKKSYEGSLACFAACFVAGLFLFNWKFALIGAVIASTVEAMPFKSNDNFWMQIINALVLTLLAMVLNPF